MPSVNASAKLLTATVLLVSFAAKLMAVLLAAWKSLLSAVPFAVLTYTVEAKARLLPLRVIVKTISPPSLTAVAALAALELTA